VVSLFGIPIHYFFQPTLSTRKKKKKTTTTTTTKMNNSKPSLKSSNIDRQNTRTDVATSYVERPRKSQKRRKKKPQDKRARRRPRVLETEKPSTTNNAKAGGTTVAHSSSSNNVPGGEKNPNNTGAGGRSRHAETNKGNKPGPVPNNASGDAAGDGTREHSVTNNSEKGGELDAVSDEENGEHSDEDSEEEEAEEEKEKEEAMEIDDQDSEQESEQEQSNEDEDEDEEKSRQDRLDRYHANRRYIKRLQSLLSELKTEELRIETEFLTSGANVKTFRQEQALGDIAKRSAAIQTTLLKHAKSRDLQNTNTSSSSAHDAQSYPSKLILKDGSAIRLRGDMTSAIVLRRFCRDVSILIRTGFAQRSHSEAYARNLIALTSQDRAFQSWLDEHVLQKWQENNSLSMDDITKIVHQYIPLSTSMTEINSRLDRVKQMGKHPRAYLNSFKELLSDADISVNEHFLYRFIEGFDEASMRQDLHNTRIERQSSENPLNSLEQIADLAAQKMSLPGQQARTPYQTRPNKRNYEGSYSSNKPKFHKSGDGGQHKDERETQQHRASKEPTDTAKGIAKPEHRKRKQEDKPPCPHCNKHHPGESSSCWSLDSNKGQRPSWWSTDKGKLKTKGEPYIWSKVATVTLPHFVFSAACNNSQSEHLQDGNKEKTNGCATQSQLDQLQTNETSPQILFVPGSVENKETQFHLDTGGGASLLTEKGLIELGLQSRLVKTTSEIVYGNGTRELALGKIDKLQVRYGVNIALVDFHVVKRHILGNVILGLQDMLRLSILRWKPQAVLVNQPLPQGSESQSKISTGTVIPTSGAANNKCHPDDEEKCAQLMKEIEPLLEQNRQIQGFMKARPVRLELVSRERIHIKQYKINEDRKQKISEQIEKWRKRGKIKVSRSPHNLPVLVVDKFDEAGVKKGDRVCIDPRALNKLIVQNRYPIPVIEDVLNKMSGKDWYAEIDCEDAFTQMELHADDQPYMSFTWEDVQYSFLGCPYGVKVMSAEFQERLHDIIADLPFVSNFIDNINLGTKGSWEDHKQHIITLLKRLNENNVKISTDKLKLGRREIRMLGHVVSRDGKRPDPRKVADVMSIPFPTDHKQLQHFLGVCNFLRGHVRQMSSLTALLDSAKHDAATFNTKITEHGAAMKKDFDTIKQALAHTPILKFPDSKRPFRIALDASRRAVGAVLYQLDDEQLSHDDTALTANNLVAVRSRSLRDYERNYPAFKLELTALRYALQEFEQFFQGTPVHVQTDHKALTYLLDGSKQNHVLAHWLDDLTKHNITLEHVPGVSNLLPDHLSRMYSEGDAWGVPNNIVSMRLLNPQLEIANPHPIVSAAVQTRSTSRASAPGALASSSAPSTKPPEPPSKPIKIKRSPELQAARAASASTASAAPAAPQTKDDKRPQPVIAAPTPNSKEKEKAELMILLGRSIPPEEKRKDIIKQAHQEGHYGEYAIIQKLYSTMLLWWPGMQKQVHEICSQCESCQRHNITKRGYHPIHSPNVTLPWDCLQVDLVTMDPTEEGNTYILMCIDLFSSFVITRALKNKTATEVGRQLYEIFCTFGPPKVLQSDSGSEFVNETLKEITNTFHTDYHIATPTSHSSQGPVERVNRTVEFSLKKMLDGSTTSWDKALPMVTLYYNITVKRTSKSSPYTIFFTHAYNRNTNQSLPTTFEVDEWSEEEWKDHQQKVLDVVYPAITENTKKAKSKSTADFEKRHHIVPPLLVGQYVMINDDERTSKHQPAWIGPYKITKVSEDGSYTVEMLINDTVTSLRRDRSKLKPVPPPAPNASPIYRIDHIVRHEGEGASAKYLVKWQGFPSEANSWVKATDFVDGKVVRDYRRKEVSSKRKEVSSNSKSNDAKNAKRKKK